MAQAPTSKMPLADSKQVMTYEVYAGGINAVTAKLDVEVKDKGRYKIALDAFTRGFLGKLVPWKGLFESQGWKLSKGDRPELHKSITTWRNEEEVKEYSYGKDGSFKAYKVTEGDKDKSPKKPDDKLTQGTTDALTATFEIMQAVAAGKSCDGSSEVFDGARRYELAFSDEGKVDLHKNSYNLFDGKATKCQVEVKPVAGKWHEKPRGWMSIQEQGREHGSLPTVWMGQLEKDAPAVPVKIRVKTDYGTLFMHLVAYQNGDKKISLD